MPIVTPNPVTIIPAKTSGGSLKNAANLISYSGAAQGEAKELWGATTKALRDAQSQLDGVTNALRATLPLPDPIQVTDATGVLVAPIGQFLSPLTNASYQGIWAKNLAMDWDPLAHGAVGDGVADDTNALQKTITNSGGILYLSPGKIYKTSSTLTFPSTNFLSMIWGGGGIVSSASPAVLISGSSANVIIKDVFIESNVASGIALSMVNGTSGWNQITNCFFSSTSAGTGINLNNNHAGFLVVGCTLNGGLTTGIALTTQLDVDIIGCEFTSNVTTPVSTSGTCTYNLRGCNVLDFHDPVVPWAIGFQNSAATSLPNNTLQDIFFDTNATGSNSNIHSTSSNTNQFKALVAGLWKIDGQMQAPTTTGILELTVRKNGSTGIPHNVQTVVTNAGTGPTVAVSTIAQLALNDIITFTGFQNSGAPINTVTSVTWGSMYLLSQP